MAKASKAPKRKILAFTVILATDGKVKGARGRLNDMLVGLDDYPDVNGDNVSLVSVTRAYEGRE